MENSPASLHSAGTPPDPEKAEHTNHLESIKTNEKVPGHTNYYEKDGLRTYGDHEDHDHEPPVRFPLPRLPRHGLTLCR